MIFESVMYLRMNTVDASCSTDLGEGDGLDSYTDAGNVNIVEAESSEDGRSRVVAIQVNYLNLENFH